MCVSSSSSTTLLHCCFVVFFFLVFKLRTWLLYCFFNLVSVFYCWDCTFFLNNGCFICQAEPINANCYQEIVQLRSQFDCVEWYIMLNMWLFSKCLHVWWSHTFEKGAFCLFSKSNLFDYFSEKNSIFSSRQREISIRRVLLKFAKTRSQNVNHSFRIFFLKWVYHFFPLYIGWFVCFVFVRPVVALIRLLTNECLLLTHITSSPRLAGAEGSPSRGPRAAGPRVDIFINSYNPLHFVYSIDPFFFFLFSFFVCYACFTLFLIRVPLYDWLLWHCPFLGFLSLSVSVFCFVSVPF